MPHFDATSLPRAMVCAASRSMPTYTHAVGMDQTDDAREGIAAHWLAASILTGKITDLTEWAERKAPNGVYITDEVIDAVSYYLEQLRTRPTARRDVERDLIAGGPAFHGVTIGCRPDFIADDLGDYNRRIYIDDFKYGHRIVEPDMNWTLIAHACAYVQDKRIDAGTYFEFRIHQPRSYHPNGKTRVWVIDAAHLMALRQQLFTTLASPDTTVTTSNHCYKCPSQTFCPASRKVSLSVLDMVETAIPDNMTLDEMSFMMDALTVGAERLKQYKIAMAERMTDALMRGERIRNYRMKPTDGRLEWEEWVTPQTLRLLSNGKPVSKETPITPTQAMKFIPEAIVNSMSKRKKGGLTLERCDTDQLAQRLFGKSE